MRTCRICGVTEDIIEFTKGRLECRCCYNERRANYQKERYKDKRNEIRKIKNEYKRKNKLRYNRLERKRYRKVNNVSPLSYRVSP